MQSQTARTILIVEDVDEISRKMQDVLVQRGHEVLHASNADDAMRITEKHRPSMILTDLDFPTLTKLMKWLREHHVFAKMVVAIFDINQPELPDQSINVLANLSELDSLIGSLPPRTAI